MKIGRNVGAGAMSWLGHMARPNFW